MLVVISIIILLGGIVLFAVSGVLKTAKEHATKVQFENAISILSEYERHAKLNVSNRPVVWYFSVSTSGQRVDLATDQNADILDFWNIPQASGAGAGTLRTPVALPPQASVREGDDGRDCRFLDSSLATQDFYNDAMCNTVIAFQKFHNATSVREMISKTPADKLYIVKNNLGLQQTVFPGSPAPLPALPPILLDGWNNPIIYVPTAGLRVLLKMNAPGDRSKWQTVTITSPDKRPFFASAGADGSFNSDSDTTDNLYSFEK